MTNRFANEPIMKETKRMKPLVKKRSSQLIMIFFLCIFILTGVTLAFDFSPAHAQDSGRIQSYSLKGIYEKLESLGEYIKSGAPVARTGQTESSANGDDGDLQKGFPGRNRDSSTTATARSRTTSPAWSG